MDAGKQAPGPVGDAGGFTSRVVVEIGEPLQLCQGFVADIDGSRGAGQGTRGVGDDERVSGISLHAWG